LRAFSDPNIDCDRQPIFWSPEVLPIVLHLQPARPDLTSNPLDVGAALTAPSAGTHRTGATTDVLIAQLTATHRLWLDQDPAGAMAVVIPLDRLFEYRTAAALNLWRALKGLRPLADPMRLSPFEVLELILKAGIKISMVGDHRQATLKTNHGSKNSAFAGFNIIKKFQQWEQAGLASLTYEQHTHRCHQQIADLGDSFFPSEPPTKSLNTMTTGHDGVFIVATAKVAAYVATYATQVLRFDRKTLCLDLPAMNFGESKGLTFARVLIFPHGMGKKWLSSASVTHVEKSVTKMYVGATRARHSLAFVFDGLAAIPGAQIYE
jgi:hypothetical protein